MMLQESPVFALVALFGATSGPSIPSDASGNGHNVSFDGRLYMGHVGVDGWAIRMLRPEAARYRADGFPDLRSDMWSPGHRLLGPGPIAENALAICESQPDDTPYRCDAEGRATEAGRFACYDLWIIDSDASLPPDHPNAAFMRRRGLKVWVDAPETSNAAVLKHEWTEAPVRLAPVLRGIEPTVTRDGRLLMWNGHADNDGKNDHLIYAYNETPCGLSGWDGPHPLSHMAHDVRLVGTYRLAERALRSTDGTVFADGQPVHGAYPWLFQDGEAVIFAAAPMPCRAEEDPPGCGPRRNAMAVVGYPTNWGIAVIDGGINPSTEDEVRLFFTSPGPHTFDTLPVTSGLDIWPFFGTNTSNYVEVSFDDGLDGQYAGYWHMNEGVTPTGGLDFSNMADVSGYFNTARAAGVGPPSRDLINGPVVFNGRDNAVTISDAPDVSLTHVLTAEMRVRIGRDPDCDEGNNFRVLLEKIGSYSIFLEETRVVQARIFRDGGDGPEYNVISSAQLPMSGWAHVALRYTAASGELTLFFDGSEVGRTTWDPAPIADSDSPLTVGGPAITRPVCPDGYGVFDGEIDDVDISERTVESSVSFPAQNNGALGKAAVLDGRGGSFTVAHAASLSPVNGITVDMTIAPEEAPDCDAENNYRILLRKAGEYSLILEDNSQLQGRVWVEGGTEYSIWSQTAIPTGRYSRVAFTYEAASGEMIFYIDGEETARESYPPAPLGGGSADLVFGGPGAVRPACPDGEGAFLGRLDEVSISRVARTFEVEDPDDPNDTVDPTDPDDLKDPDDPNDPHDPRDPSDSADPRDPALDSEGGSDGCAATGSTGVAGLFATAVVVVVRRGRAGRRRRRS